jgi:hypothetical protein
MEISELIERYPRLYHMAEAGSWPSVRHHGLLSTSALLDLFEVNGNRRRALESERRPESVEITHPDHGTAIIRDQIPLREGPLSKCLRGMTLSEWYEALNRRVFFWMREERLVGLLRGRAYRGRPHDVLTIDTAGLVDAHSERITLTPINTGSTIFNPQPRGVGTFLAISDYPYDEWRRRRGPRDAVVELAVDYSIPDVADHTAAVESRQEGTVLETIWRR